VRVAVLTVDQRSSRTGPDLVPATLEQLAGHHPLLPFERTVGDELQGAVADPDELARIVATLLRADAWNIGIGLGELDEPLPPHTRAGRGTAYLRARTAVTSAKTAPWHLRVVGEQEETARALESALWLWAALLHRRTTKGWEVVDLLDTGLTHDEAAAQLGITQSAVTQRARAAGLTEGRRAHELARHLASGQLGRAS
jgi:hypothetical protein